MKLKEMEASLTDVAVSGELRGQDLYGLYALKDGEHIDVEKEIDVFLEECMLFSNILDVFSSKYGNSEKNDFNIFDELSMNIKLAGHILFYMCYKDIDINSKLADYKKVLKYSMDQNNGEKKENE